MALKGNLRDFSTTQLLNLINLARKTGTLTIEGPSEASTMSFYEGKLIFAQIGAEDGGLATILQKQGKLNERQADALRQRTRTLTDKELGLLLINAGYLTQSDIINSVREYIRDVAFRLFTWVEGIFSFDAETLPGDDRIVVPIGLDNIIIEGSRRMREWERLQEDIPDLDMALTFTDQPRERLKGLNLNVEEWRVVSAINPKNTMREIARANKLSDLELRRIVYSLMQAGVVTIVPPRRPQQQPVEAVRDRSIVTRLIRRIQSL